jgi:hypothetical protein
VALRSVAATRDVTPLREGGSLPALVEADDDGLCVPSPRRVHTGLCGEPAAELDHPFEALVAAPPAGG